MAIEENNNKAPHILNASSNLVGFSFLLLSAVKLFGLSYPTFVDDIAAVEVLLFSVSSLFSFLSMRSRQTSKSLFYESLADVIFFAGLTILCFAAVLFAFSVIK